MIDVKVSGKRETVNELTAVKSEPIEEKPEDNAESKEPNSNLLESNENTEKGVSVNERVVEKDDEDEETRRLPKYVAGNPVGEFLAGFP